MPAVQRACAAACGAIVLAVCVPARSVDAQRGSAGAAVVPESATVTIAAGERYKATPLHAWLSGSSYRDLWATPIRVPVLNLRTFAGGLHPTKEGGGMQTKSLRFKTADGTEYVFRLTDKAATGSFGPVKNAIADRIFQDQVSAMHPAGAQIAQPIMTAVRVLHPTGEFMVMPDDTLLGKFRGVFAGRLGLFEEFPNVPDKAPGFAGASKIIDSEELLKLMDADPSQYADARAFLAARLVDFLINDNDRHEGNWKWARIKAGPAGDWEPIAVDRDHAFVSYDGALMAIGRRMATSLVSFDATLNVGGLTQSGALDERLLAGLDKPAWDSVARGVQSRVTDSVIHAAAMSMPREYQATAPQLEATLRARRAAIAAASDQFYATLARRVLVHGTDTTDRATITRSSDGIVDVALESGGKRFFSRRFDARETSEILVYLHGGNDTAVVTGHVAKSILVRVIGGNGTNTLVDSSVVSDDADATRIYENGAVHGVSYGPDTLFDRRPWEMQDGVLSPPRPDDGNANQFLAGLSLPRRLGATPRVGFARNDYGFAHRPYETRVGVEGEYALQFGGVRVNASADRRLESSGLHFTSIARLSDLEFVSYHGLGNATIDAGQPSTYYDVRRREWLFNPAVALAIGPDLDLSLGPVIEHSGTDSTRSRSLAALRPYGFGSFNYAGARGAARYQWMAPADSEEHRRATVVAGGDVLYVPAMMSILTPFERGAVALGATIPLETVTQPMLVVRAGGTKLHGQFPYFDAATIGGESTMAYLDPDRYAGDASLYGSTELRLLLLDFRFIAPWQIGVLGVAEAGRVYDHGSSPGGWHALGGEGVWFGMKGATSALALVHTTNGGRGAFQLRFARTDVR